VNLTKEQVLGFSIIDSRLKIFVKQGSVSAIQQQSSSTQSNTDSPVIEEPQISSNDIPDINNRDGDIIYYKSLGTATNQNWLGEDIVDSSNPRVIYEVWKKGDKYYARINPKAKVGIIAYAKDIYLDLFFNYNSVSEITSIKNIEPAVFDGTTKLLIKKGKVELS